MKQTQRLTAILPCNNLDLSEAFYRRLGFEHRDGIDGYRMLHDGRGGEIHLTEAVEGLVDTGAESVWTIPLHRTGGRVGDEDGLRGGKQTLGNV